MAGILTSSPYFKGLPAQTSHFTEKVFLFSILFSLHQLAHPKGGWNQLIGLKIVLVYFVSFVCLVFLMHSSHLSPALLSPFECSSPTPKSKSTVCHGNRPNRRNTQSLKEFTFSAKGWDKNKAQLQTVQHPELAATNSEARTSWRFSNFWRKQSATSQRGKKKTCKVTGASPGTSWCSDYDDSAAWTQLCSSSSLPCGWELGTEPELACELASLIGVITNQGIEKLTSLLWVLECGLAVLERCPANFNSHLKQKNCNQTSRFSDARAFPNEETLIDLW